MVDKKFLRRKYFSIIQCANVRLSWFEFYEY